MNNAGIGIGGEIEWTPVEACQKTMEVNAIGPYRVSQAFLPLLRKSQGRIVIIASVLGEYICTFRMYHKKMISNSSFIE